MSEESKNGESDLDFNLDFRKVQIKMIQGGQETMYILQDLSVPDKESYQEEVVKRLKIGPDGKPVAMITSRGLATKLLHLCLRDKDGKPVPAEMIDTWPGSVHTKLFMKARQICGLGEEGEKDAKNA